MAETRVVVTVNIPDNDRRVETLYDATLAAIKNGSFHRWGEKDELEAVQGLHTFETLQVEVSEWANRNFDTTVPEHPLMGLIEEVGELSKAQLQAICPTLTSNGQLLVLAHYIGEMAHSLLKTQQGIRGTEEAHLARFQDYLVRAANMLKCIAINMKIMPEDYTPAGYDATSIPIPAFEAGKNPIAEREDAVADIDIYMSDFCMRNGVNRQAAVEKTWARVMRRDWNSHRATGEVVE